MNWTGTNQNLCTPVQKADNDTDTRLDALYAGIKNMQNHSTQDSRVVPHRGTN